ncbi:mitochondrial resolvase Ydc2 [Dipodascopsis tothii]|uniref:mitochondrial resolvase Ydc2 n=1 Tax=Dipodascopsis tothii TaxID=44089 RepID=UPI0034CDEB7F
MAVPATTKASAKTLKQLARLCGLVGGSTKAACLDLLTPLTPAAPAATPPAPRTPVPGRRRVLSVDMGIRNFSYAILDADTHAPGPAYVHDWRRMDVLDAADAVALTPIAYSRLAYALFVQYLLPKYSPDVVVIERQRHRTGSAPALVEWAFRVNMFESAIAGVLHCHVADRGLPIAIEAVSPRTTKAFWLDAGTRLTAAQSKKACVDIVRGWASAFAAHRPADVLFSPEVAAHVARFAGERRTRAGADSEAVPTPINAAVARRDAKIDDLADSLLQGVSWLLWQRNRAAVGAALAAGADLDALATRLEAEHRARTGRA